MIEVTGFDHIYLAVRDLSVSEAYYDRLMLALGFRKGEFALGTERHVRYDNRHFGLVLRPARSDTAHDSYSPGLHHLCWRVENRDAVEAVAAHLQSLGIEISGPKLHTEYAPDYYAVFFTDPDGIRLEITNYRQERRDRFENWKSPSVKSP